MRQLQLLLLLLYCTESVSGGSPLASLGETNVSRHRPHYQWLSTIRGGDGSKKRTKKSTTSKKVIDSAMKEKDAAQALGDAIRERADTLRAEATSTSHFDMDNPLLQQWDQSISSVGWAMGTSDTTSSTTMEDSGGGVEASKSSMVANYFLQSHGGAHAIQSICSILAVLAAVGSILTSGQTSLVLMKRTMILAMTKHVSGVLAATMTAAKGIPQVGLRKSKLWMEQLALDPVSQYVFYSALMLVWLPTNTNMCWWWNKVPTVIFVGPILLREWISTMFVVSDILVLTVSTKDGVLSSVWRTGTFIVNAMLSLLVTPTVWRNASAAARQAVLAKLTSNISLVLEVVVGVILVLDGLYSMWEFSIHSPRPPLWSVAKRCVCARLYVNFLWKRKNKIHRLANTIRGGATEVPMYIMDALLHPASVMGLELMLEPNKVDPSWKDYTIMALGLDE